MNVALVYDRVNKMGGAERVLLALHELFPKAPLYTAVYNPKTAAWASVFRVEPTWMNQVPFAKTNHELYPWLTPFAFESIEFDTYDVVISVTSAEAKSIITKPKTLHICYCLTPTRYLWSGYQTYQKYPGFGVLSSVSRFFLKTLRPVLQSWDRVSSTRPDYMVTISNHVAKRIKRYYHRISDAVIYPPVDTDFFIPSKEQANAYYIYVSRLVSYKRPDIVIDAFNKNGYPLVVIGEGSEKKSLMEKSKGNITFTGGILSDTELLHYYQNAKALVFTGEEDFGIVAGEAQSVGKPVIAYAKSGIAEIVVDGKTGILFHEQTVPSFSKAIELFERTRFDANACRLQALKFTKDRFKEEFLTFTKSVYNNCL